MWNSRSDGNYDPCLLDECPLTGQLMYYSGYSPLGWFLVTYAPVQRAYEDWLCDKYFTS